MASMTGSRGTAAGVLVVGGSLLLTLILGASVGGLGYGLSEALLFGGGMAYFLVLGTTIIWRVPGNRVGWVFALIAVGVGVAGVAGGIADRGLVVFDAIGSAAWMVALGSVFLLLLWYPTGRVSGRFWRLVEGLILAVLGFAFFGTLFSEWICVEAGAAGCEVWEENPIGVVGVPYPEYWEPFANLVLVAVATLTVAGLFNPLRRRVQRVVDRRFNRSRYDAERVIGHFSGSLQELVDPDEVVEDWIGVVSETMRPASVGVWVREG